MRGMARRVVLRWSDWEYFVRIRKIEITAVSRRVDSDCGPRAASSCRHLFTFIQLTLKGFGTLMTTRSSGALRYMKRTNKMNASLAGFGSGASLGGKISHYRGNQNIYEQGSPAYTLFYIQEGGVRLTTKSNRQASAVTAILGVHDFFGELCLAGYPLRMSTAIALTGSSIRT